MTLVHLFLTPLVFMMLATVATGATKEPLHLIVDNNQKEQGQFFCVTVSNATAKPELWFMERRYRMFQQSDSSWRALVPVENFTTPGSYTLRLRTGSHEEQIPVTITPNNRPIQHIALDSTKAALKATGLEKSRVKQALHTESKKKLFEGLFLRPVTGPTTSLFGLKRSYNNSPVDSYHKGIDISAPQGTAVQSAAKGIIMLTGTVEEGFQVHGNTVIINHGQGLTSVYLHLSAITVHEGQLVEAGEVIGNVGHTGISTAPHLHWGIYLYGTSVDPELFEGKAL